MNGITNKHLFVTMVIIGIITIALILRGQQGFYGYTGSTSYRSSLGASVYDAFNTDTSNTPDYVWYKYPGSESTTTSTAVPQTTTTYYYTYQQQPQTYTDTYYYNDTRSYYQGYVPAGCETGTDYSTITGEACG